jgi:uncharacterized membrane protein
VGLNRTEQRVLSAVIAAVRQRRAQEMSRLLWRVAPVIAAAVLLLAAAVRWFHASRLIPLAVLVTAGLTWVLVAAVRRRVDRVSDETASAIDDEVRLGGELRSATWFASHSTSDPWAEFHLEHAAARLESIDFAAHYPPVHAPRARIATGVMMATAVVLAIVFPQRPRASSPHSDTPLAPAAHKVAPVAVEGLPPELPQDLEDLLAAIENGTLSSNPADAALLGTLKNLQSVQDPQALAALARALAANAAKLDDKAVMKDLADRAARDADITPSSDVKNALDQLAKKLSDPESEMDSAGLEKSDEPQPNGGVDVAGASQSMRDTSAIASMGMVAISKQDSAQTDAPPGVGAGGSSSSTPNGGGVMPDIAEALRHEVVEAHEDDVSGDVHSDERRKTEHGNAATAFTHSAAGQSDGSRAVAPPTVPESRRAGLQTYFTRKQ